MLKCQHFVIISLSIYSNLSFYCVYTPVANPATSYIQNTPCTSAYQIPLYGDMSSKMLQYNTTVDWSLIINYPNFLSQATLTSALTSLSTNMTQNLQTMSNSLQSNLTSGLTNLSANMSQNLQTVNNSLQSNIISGLASLSTNITQNLQAVNNSLQNQLQILETEIAQSNERIKQLELYKYLSFINSGVIAILLIIILYLSCKKAVQNKQRENKRRQYILKYKKQKNKIKHFLKYQKLNKTQVWMILLLQVIYKVGKKMIKQIDEYKKIELIILIKINENCSQI